MDNIDDEEFENMCSSCGADHGGVEIEWCSCGEHCEYCSQECDTCGMCYNDCECGDSQ